MVDAINGVNNKNRNAAIGAGVGLVGAGAAGYLTTSILDKEKNIKDEFIHKAVLLSAADKDEKKYFNLSKLLSSMDENSSVSSMKKMLGKMDNMQDSSSIAFDEKDLNIIKNGSDDEIKTLFKETKDMFCENYELLKDDIRSLIDEVYDKSSKKFTNQIDTLTEEGKAMLPKVKKLVTHIKLKQAAIWGGTGAVCAGLVSYLATPSAKRQKTPASQNADTVQANS